MRSVALALVSMICVGFVSGCASTAALKKQHAGYRYNGEKYGAVVVTQTDKVAKDTRKLKRIEEMALDAALADQLKAADLFSESATNTVRVVIDSLHIRNAFNAVMWGFLAGADSVGGTVTLESGDSVIGSFDVKASYALGGTAGGQNKARLGWLGKRFAEETVNMIKGKP